MELKRRRFGLSISGYGNMTRLVGWVTDGRYGLMKDLVMCKERGKAEGREGREWGNECIVES